MNNNFPHLSLRREEPVTEKRSSRPPHPKTPDNPSAHGQALQQHLNTAKLQTATDIGGFDERRLFRFNVGKGFNPDDLRKLSSEIEFISQENEEAVLAFVSSSALESFEANLATIISGGKTSNKTVTNIIYALKGIEGWSAEDRTGWALQHRGLPESQSFILDIELWPLEDNQNARNQLWQRFETWLSGENIEKTDSVKQPGLTLYRVRCNHSQAEKLLHHRDVRTVDLPPQYGLKQHLLSTDIQSLSEVLAPPENAPGIVILDSGLTTSHPLLKAAVGDAQSFLLGKDAADEHGHGTHVAGLALYGDVEVILENNDNKFIPKLRLFSGRILDEKNESNTKFVENQIIEAVTYFNKEYACKVFNLSFGDSNKPYLGGHVRGLSYTLDILSRELDVLFIVSAGNMPISKLSGLDWKTKYPEYLNNEDWAIIEPAPALNVLTVGSLARYDQSFNSQRYANDPAESPISRRNQPSPFTRHGPSIGGAIKPELLGYGGNWAINTRAGTNALVDSGLGELSTHWNFTTGNLFSLKSGTSMAAPHVAYLAANLLSEYPKANSNLLRALLVAHASVPEESKVLFENDDKLRQVCGYGRVNHHALFHSLENEVTLFSDERITNKHHHFYEIPIPDEFITKGKRLREITIAIAYLPHVRSTRINYKATRIDFKLVTSSSLDHVKDMFNKATDKNSHKNIPELNGADINARRRGKGTVQVATWKFERLIKCSPLSKKRLFVVITRNDYPWGEIYSSTEESYSLVICLRDRENEQARLYTELRTRLQARTRARVRV